jgi:hypothetical protein
VHVKISLIDALQPNILTGPPFDCSQRYPFFFMHEPLNLIWFLISVLNEELMGTYGLDETSQMEPASE